MCAGSSSRGDHASASRGGAAVGPPTPIACSHIHPSSSSSVSASRALARKKATSSAESPAGGGERPSHSHGGRFSSSRTTKPGLGTPLRSSSAHPSAGQPDVAVAEPERAAELALADAAPCIDTLEESAPRRFCPPPRLSLSAADLASSWCTPAAATAAASSPSAAPCSSAPPSSIAPCSSGLASPVSGDLCCCECCACLAPLCLAERKPRRSAGAHSSMHLTSAASSFATARSATSSSERPSALPRRCAARRSATCMKCG
mmetsp:Transcript_59155/g.135664  ORF Transcript_59155/g.135664 Transcript_59155/m.135664 type:complete len:261 (-) Transcript_59155:2720-3502(-)